MVRTPRGTGWFVEVEHPTTGRVLQPDVLDDPQRTPTANAPPTLSIPVRRNEAWQNSDWEGATMRVFFDGVRQPVDELETPRVTPEQTLLEGRGAPELRTHVTPQYDFRQIHLAAQDLITNNTSYTANVDTPETTTTENTTVQSADTTTEFTDRLREAIPATAPLSITGDLITTQQTLFFYEAEDEFVFTGTVGDADASEGSTEQWEGSITDTATFTTDYVIPDGELAVAIRGKQLTGTTVSAGDINIDGATLDTGLSSGDYPTGSFQWFHFDSTHATYSSIGDLAAGNHTIEFEAQQNGDEAVLLDVIVVYDDRFSYLFDDAVDANNHLDGPQLFPDARAATEVVFADVEVTEAVSGGRVETVWNDPAGNELALSNDRGQSYATSAGADTFEHDFADLGPTLRWRARLGRTGSGRTDSPTQGYLPQVLQSFTLKADTKDVGVLIDQRFEGQLEDVLAEMADLDDAIWEYSRDGGASVEWSYPAQRTTNKTPNVAGYESSKTTADIVERARVKGASLQVRDETVTADHGTAVALAHDHLISAQERVFDASQVYQRDVDYTMDYDVGEITTRTAGDITDGATISIDYRYKPFGEATAAGVSNPRTETFELTSITTDRGAALAAQRIVTALQDPQWDIQVVIPNDEAGWSVVEAIDPPEVPTGGAARHINAVTTTPGQTVLSLANRQDSRDVIDEIDAWIGSISDKI